MKNSKWKMLLTALSMAAVLAGCGSGAGEDTAAFAPDASPESSVVSGTDSEPMETTDAEQEDDGDSGTEAESKVEEYILWTGTYSLYAGDSVYTGVLKEAGYDMSGNLILEGLSSRISDSIFLDYVLKEYKFITSWTKWDYDEYGNVTKESTLRSHDITNDTAVRDWTEYEYDAQGNLIKETDSGGSWTEYEYDAQGNLIKETNERGVWTEYEYDASGNLLKETCEYWWLEYEYDASGNLTKEQHFNSSGKVTAWTEYEYDAQGNLIKTTGSSSSGWTEYEYDASGNLTKQQIFGSDGSVSSWREYEYAASDECPPGTQELFSVSTMLRDNPIKITWYDYQGNIDKIWEWSFEIIRE